MKIGLAILPKLPFDDLVPLARYAEEQGFASLWIPDERFFRDPFVCLSAVAAATENVMIGTGVTDPFIRHPLLTASAIATVREYSNGRAVLGMGAGISGFDALGIERKAPATAIRRTIDASRKFWAGEPVSGDLGAYTSKNVSINYSTEDVPVYVAGRGPKVLELGGEAGQGVLIGHFTSAEGIEWSRVHIERGLEKRDHAKLGDLDLALWAYTSIHPNDRNKAFQSVKPSIGRTLKSTVDILGIFGCDSPELRADLDGVAYGRGEKFDADMCAIVPDQLTQHLSISGNPEDCLETLQKIEAAGVKHVVILPYPPAELSIPEMVRVFAEQVLPHVK